MECIQTSWLSNREYLLEFNRKIAQMRIPFTGSLDLTHRCNLKCIHCYLGGNGNNGKLQKKELSTTQWISIIDDITKAGCLSVLLTGGEPLSRKDFIEIYRHAKTNGLLLTVFTNGTLITEKLLKLFDELPPKAVEISLYGATQETYEKVTRVPGSYERCLEGIRQLLDHQINVKLKTILMTLNRHEFYAIKNMAEEFGVRFRFDPVISPCFNGDKTPIQLRISPEEVIEKEFSEKEKIKDWQNFLNRYQGHTALDALYQCGAGLTAFHIDAYGNLQPCLMLKRYQYSLLKGSFMEGWHDFIPRFRQRKAGAGFVCRQCEMRMLCGFCPAFFELENGEEEIPSKYFCEIGRLRYEMLENGC